MAKSTCPVTRAEFFDDAKPVEVVINGIPMTAEVKEFATGSLGWYLNGKGDDEARDDGTVGLNLNAVLVVAQQVAATSQIGHCPQSNRRARLPPRRWVDTCTDFPARVELRPP